jgi:hypothetical protein
MVGGGSLNGTCRSYIYLRLHPIFELKSADHRIPAQWEVYVAESSRLPRQKSIALSGIRQLTDAVRFEQLLSSCKHCSLRRSRSECVFDAATLVIAAPWTLPVHRSLTVTEGMRFRGVGTQPRAQSQRPNHGLFAELR